MKILGIETSCDECAAAVVKDGREVLSEVVASQVEVHARYGGVVPEIASRQHLEAILPVIDQALKGAGSTIHDMDAVAVTNRPGLIGALLVGLSAAKGLALAAGKPLIPVDHIEAHIYACLMHQESPKYPMTALVVSGGHTSLYRLPSLLEIETFSNTLDDAAGEAFDKVSSILNLGYPGGPALERAAKGHGEGSISFPRSYPGGERLNFSFSGLKTAVLYHCRGGPGKIRQEKGLKKFDPSNPDDVGDVAASFQTAVVDVLVTRTFQAAERLKAVAVAVGGGVAANKLLRQKLKSEAERRGLDLYLAPPRLTTDNAVMVAGYGYALHQEGRIAGLDVDAYPR
jgi:N6-L-threonylcarbamoyladenine synthase